MTGEEMERAIEFILQSQASSEARLDRIEAAIDRLEGTQERSQSQIDQTQLQLDHLTKVVASIADQTQRNSDDINVLAKIVDRLVEGRNGKS
jgi:septal ring factor EnvC (AmiA/AmiB activator)